MPHLPTPRRARAIAAAAALTLAASAAVTATLPAAASAQAAAELRLSMPRLDPRLTEFALEARCAAACTVRLDTIGVVLYPSGGFGAGDQLPGAAEARLKGTRRLAAGQSTTFEFQLPPQVRTFILSAIAQKTVAFTTISANVTPNGSETFPATTQATIHSRSTPNRRMAGLTDIEVPDGVRPAGGSGGVRRYAITVKADQRTDWSYQRDETNGACKVISNGSGWQTLKLRSTRPIVARLWHERGGMVLSGGIARKNWYWVYAGVPVRVDAERDGVRNAGAEGSCDGLPAGGESGSGGGAPECVRRGSRQLPVHLTANGPHLSAWLTLDVYDRGPGVPDCPFERLHQAKDDYELLPAFVMRDSDPTRFRGDPGKFIIVEDKARTDQIGGGSVRERAGRSRSDASDSGSGRGDAPGRSEHRRMRSMQVHAPDRLAVWSASRPGWTERPRFGPQGSSSGPKRPRSSQGTLRSWPWNRALVTPIRSLAGPVPVPLCGTR